MLRMNLSKFLACLMIALLPFALAACGDDEDSNTNPTTADATGDSSGSTSGQDGTSGADTSGTSGADTSGTSGTDTSGTSGTTTDTSGGDTSGVVSNTIVDIAVSDPNFSTLVAALTAADLVTTLQGEGPFTVFAPTNAAFAKLPAGAVDDLLLPENKDELSAVLLYHVVAGDLDAAEVTAASLLTTVQGSKAKITVTNGEARIGGALISTTNIQADNGVIHIIDDVIMPPGSIAEIVSADANFSTLLAAVAAADLAGPLGAAAPKLTVFAPTNAAFEKVPADTLTALLDPANKAVLTKVLLYHAAAGEFEASQVVGLDSVETLSGFDAPISTDGGPQIDGAAISATDIPASNGIIHVIDDVIMPPTIADIASANPDFETLVAALVAADLVEAVSDPFNPITVFAPTDDAFAALPAGTLDDLLLPENKQQLTDILLYHVVAGEQDAAAVTAATTLPTLLDGASLTVSTASGPMVNDSNITATDIAAFNGIIHVIDAVLLPPAP